MSIKEWFHHHDHDNVRDGELTPKHYTNPYLIGLLLGIVLLATFVIMGRGMGASGVLSTVVSVGVEKVLPASVEGNDFYQGYLGDGESNPFKNWLSFEILGMIIGGFISGAISGRNKITIEKGPRATNKMRLTLAFIGGSLMGFGAKMARGCTSGQALTGGTMLSVGGWVFMLAVFAGAYAFAYFVRRQWT